MAPTKPIPVRLTEGELAEIDKFRAETGESRSAYLRNAVMTCVWGDLDRLGGGRAAEDQQVHRGTEGASPSPENGRQARAERHSELGNQPESRPERGSSLRAGGPADPPLLVNGESRQPGVDSRLVSGMQSQALRRTEVQPSFREDVKEPAAPKAVPDCKHLNRRRAGFGETRRWVCDACGREVS